MAPPQRMWIDNVIKKKKPFHPFFEIYFIIVAICLATQHRENVVSSSASLAPITGSCEGVSSLIYWGGGIHAVRLFSGGEFVKTSGGWLVAVLGLRRSVGEE